MKKLLILFVFLAGLIGAGVAYSSDLTLYQCYQSNGMAWESVADRAIRAAEVGIWNYRGTADQNKALSKALCGEVGYSVATGYQKTLRTSMTSTQTTVPVTSLTLRDGTVLSTTNLGTKIFLTLEPGKDKEEIVLCTGVDATNLNFTGCTRGLAFAGTSVSAVSANQEAHNAGSTVVMSNVHYVYEQLVDTNADEFWDGVKTASSTQFVLGTGVSSTIRMYYKNSSATGTSAFIQFNNGLMGWSDNGTDTYTFVAGGSGLTASSTKGITITDSKILVNASSTGGLEFSSGALQIKAGTGITVNSSGVNVNGTQTFDNTSTTLASFSGKTWFNASSTHTSSTFDQIILNGSDVSHFKTFVTSSVFITPEYTSGTIGTTSTIPAGALGTQGVAHFQVVITDFDWYNDSTAVFNLKYGTTIIATVTFSGMPTLANQFGKIDGYVYANGTNSQKGVLVVETSTSSSLKIGTGTASLDSTSVQTMTVEATLDAGANSSLIWGYPFVEVRTN